MACSSQLQKILQAELIRTSQCGKKLLLSLSFLQEAKVCIAYFMFTSKLTFNISLILSPSDKFLGKKKSDTFSSLNVKNTFIFWLANTADT